MAEWIWQMQKSFSLAGGVDIFGSGSFLYLTSPNPIGTMQQAEGIEYILGRLAIYLN